MSQCEVVVTRLDQDLETLGLLVNLLSTDERARASRFVFDRDRDRFIVARARLRQLLGVRLSVRPDVVELIYGDHGKPELSPRFSDSKLRFNLSHADDVAAYAFSRGRDVGIDVEVVRPIPDADAVAARVFSSREATAYRALDAPDKPVGFFNGWTRKEAFIKALGAGLSYPLDRFDVTLTPGEPARILRVEDTDGERCGWSLQAFAPGPGLIGALVVGIH